MLFAERSGAAGGGQASLHREGGRWWWGGEGEGKRLREGEERRGEKRRKRGEAISLAPLLKQGGRGDKVGPAREKSVTLPDPRGRRPEIRV